MKWVIIIVVIAAVLGGGVFLLTSSDDNNGDDSSNNSQQASSSEQTTIRNLLANGGDVQCTYDYTDDSGVRNQGQAYFSQERMFGDFSATQTDGEVYQANVLVVDNVQYVWPADSNEGYKLDLSVVQDSQEDDTVPEDEDVTFDQDQELDFDCQSWNVDESLFTVPDNVTFTDNSALIEQATENLENLSEVCANIPDAAQRAACEEAL